MINDKKSIKKPAKDLNMSYKFLYHEPQYKTLRRQAAHSPENSITKILLFPKCDFYKGVAKQLKYLKIIRLATSFLYFFKCQKYEFIYRYAKILKRSE